MRITPQVADALADGRPVVALESTLISHGLPRPRNLGVAHEVEATVRGNGAVPATVAVVAGEARIGLDDLALREIANRGDVVKCGVRDLAPVAARGGYGATTVAATAHLAARAGIRVFATGGLGGVRFAGFYLTDSGHPAPWRVDSPADVAAVVAARARLGTEARAVVVANPLAPDEQLDPILHDRVLSAGLEAADREGVAGKQITPFLLDFLHRETAGASLVANLRLVVRNAALAAEIAAAMPRA